MTKQVVAWGSFYVYILTTVCVNLVNGTQDELNGIVVVSFSKYLQNIYFWNWDPQK